MAYCSNCGKQLESGVKFCKECGASVNNETSENKVERKIEYQGTVVKCPSCGAEVPSMSAICPECGHEFNAVKISDTLNKFIKDINECDSRIAAEPKTNKGWSSWSKNQRIWWVILNIFTLCIPIVIKSALPLITINKTPKLSVAEQQKLNLINNFTLPAERGSIVEVLRFVQGKMKLMAESSVSGNDLYWANVWNGKASELKDQAGFTLGNDSLVDSLTEKINLSMINIKKKARNKTLIFAAIMLAIIVFLATYNTVKPDSNNLIAKDNITFSGWLSDNYEIGEQGCSFYIKENGKTGIKLDIICNQNANDEIQAIIKSEGKDPAKYSIDGGELCFNECRETFGGYSNDTESAEIQLFTKNLFAMEEGSEKVFDLEINPVSSYKETLFSANSLVIKCELGYKEISGYDFVFVK